MARSHLLESGESEYYLPALTMLLPRREHPETAALGRETRQWCSTFPEVAQWACHFKGLSPAASIDQWLGEGFGDIWPGRCYAVGDRERIRITFDLGTWMVMADDTLSRPGPFRDADHATQVAALDRAIAVVRGDGSRADPGRPADHLDMLVLGRLLADGWYRFVRLATGHVRDRVEASAHDFLESWKEEANDRKQGRTWDFASFIEERDRRIAGGTFYPWAEFTLDIDLTAERARYPEYFRNLERLATRYLSLTNDVYSFRNDLLVADDMLNSVAVLCMSEQLSISEAMQEVAAAAEATEREFIRLREEFITGHPELRPEARSYVDCLGDVMSGTVHFFRTSPRYHGTNHDWSEIDHGRVVLDSERTVFIGGHRAEHGSGQQR